MRVFVTGSTGFVGTAVVKELLSTGHKVLGLTRSDDGIQQLKSQGAEPLRGTIEDLDLLKKTAFECDAVVHLAFNHNFSDFIGACAADRAAITALGSALAAAGGDRALVITSGTMVLQRGKLGTEDDSPDMSNPLGAARGAAEAVCLDFAKQGVRAIVVRLPPTTHGPGFSGFSGPFINVALEQNISVYVGEGQNRWCASHRDDAAKLYRLAVEKGKPGSIFHAVAEKSVQLKDIATRVGKELSIPVVSMGPEEGQAHFGMVYMRIMADNTATSTKTREELGWEPTALTLLEDIPNIAAYMKTQPAKK